MKPTGGNNASWLCKGDENLARQALERKEVLPKLPIRLKPIWTSKAVRLIPLSVAITLEVKFPKPRPRRICSRHGSVLPRLRSNYKAPWGGWNQQCDGSLRAHGREVLMQEARAQSSRVGRCRFRKPICDVGIW